MKLASIVPVHDIQHTFDGDYAMLLAHLKDYYPKNTNSQCYTIMDNSLIELGGAVSMEYLVEAAEKLHPDEIILPDIFCKGKENYESIIQSIEWLKENKLIGKYRLMAVCHGETSVEFEFYFNKIKKIPEISTIGIPKVAESLFEKEGGRPSLEHIWRFDCTKQIHLLGCWCSLTELLRYKYPQLIRSVDTCIPALLSQKGNNAWIRRPNKTIDLLNDKINWSNYSQIMNQINAEGLL